MSFCMIVSLLVSSLPQLAAILPGSTPIRARYAGFRSGIAWSYLAVYVAQGASLGGRVSAASGRRLFSSRLTVLTCQSGWVWVHCGGPLHLPVSLGVHAVRALGLILVCARHPFCHTNGLCQQSSTVRALSISTRTFGHVFVHSPSYSTFWWVPLTPVDSCSFFVRHIHYPSQCHHRQVPHPCLCDLPLLTFAIVMPPLGNLSNAVAAVMHRYIAV